MMADHFENMVEVKRDNWFLDSQIRRQLGNPAQHAVVTGRWRAFEAALRRFASPSNGVPLRVLDAGCGDGVNLIGLLRVLGEVGYPFELFATDLSPVRVARASELLPDRVLQGSLLAMPFVSGSFDVVLCNHVIEHIPAPEGAIAEIRRILKPGGLAIIGVPNEGCLIAQLRNNILQRSILRATDHVNFFTRASLASLLDKGGLTVEETRTEGFFLPHLRLSSLVSRSRIGRAFLSAMGRLFPGQAAGLIVSARRNAE